MKKIKNKFIIILIVVVIAIVYSVVSPPKARFDIKECKVFYTNNSYIYASGNKIYQMNDNQDTDVIYQKIMLEDYFNKLKNLRDRWNTSTEKQYSGLASFIDIDGEDHRQYSFIMDYFRYIDFSYNVIRFHFNSFRCRWKRCS